MKMRSIIIAVGVVAIAGVAFTYRDRLLPGANSALVTKQKPPAKEPQAISVTVGRAKIGELIETAFVNGTLVARDEILVGPEIDGLRVIEILAEEGDRVKKGQVLARLVSDTLEAQMAQNEAALARASAAIAQARSNIASAEARLVEAKNALDRGTSLGKTGVISESALDQRQSSARTAEAALSASRDALRVAEAEKAQVEAQRRELSWRQSRTAIMAPADGVISRRLARVGAFAAGAQDAMFRIIADGEVELDAEIPETILAHLKPGQRAEVSVAGVAAVNGKVRLVSPEIDRTTRLGRVRISLGNDPGLRLGAFGRGRVETARVTGVTLPVSAIMHTGDGSFVQVVRANRITTTKVDTGITSNGRIEIKSGVGDGEIVVAKSGTFLRDGDVIRPVFEESPETVKVN